MADNLIAPFGEQHPLPFIVVTDQSFDGSEVTGLLPFMQTESEWCAIDGLIGIKRFKVLIGDTFHHPMFDIAILLSSYLKE